MDTVLANFSQFPPISAKFDLCSTNLDHFWQLFSLNKFSVLSSALFANIVFWLYFGNPCINSNCFCDKLIHFQPYLCHSIGFYCNLIQTLEKNSHERNLAFYPKSSVESQFFIQIGIARLITVLYQEENVLGNLVDIQIGSRTLWGPHGIMKMKIVPDL